METNLKTHSEILSQKSKHWMDINDELFQAYKNNTIKEIISLEEYMNMKTSVIKTKVMNFTKRRIYIIERMLNEHDMRILDELIDIEHSLMNLRRDYIFQYKTFEPEVIIIRTPKYNSYLEIMEKYIGLKNNRMTESMAKSLLDLDRVENIRDNYNRLVESGKGTREALREYELLIKGLDKIKEKYYSIGEFMRSEFVY